jgi:hypothetical protein
MPRLSVRGFGAGFVALVERFRGSGLGASGAGFGVLGLRVVVGI